MPVQQTTNAKIGRPKSMGPAEGGNAGCGDTVVSEERMKGNANAPACIRASKHQLGAMLGDTASLRRGGNTSIITILYPKSNGRLHNRFHFFPSPLPNQTFPASPFTDFLAMDQISMLSQRTHSKMLSYGVMHLARISNDSCPIHGHTGNNK